MIGLCRVAGLVGDHKIVAQIEWVLGPRDEVVNMPPMTLHGLFAIEAATGLKIFENVSDVTQIRSLATKKELRQVCCRPQCIVIVPADVSDPGAPHEVADETVKLPQAERHSRPQLN